MEWFDKQAAQFEQDRFGMMALMMILQSCLGGIVAMYALYTNNYLILGTTTIVTGISNAFLIGQGGSKLCVATFYATMLLNTFLLLIQIFQ